MNKTRAMMAIAAVAMSLSGCSSTPDEPKRIMLELTLDGKSTYMLPVNLSPQNTMFEVELKRTTGSKAIMVKPTYSINPLQVTSVSVDREQDVNRVSISGAGEFDEFLINVTTPSCATSTMISLQESELTICQLPLHITHL